MKLGLFNGGRLGVIVDDLVYDVSDAVGEPIGASGRLHAAIAAVERGDLDLGPLDDHPTIPLSEVKWEAPLPRPGKIIGAPANYFDHVDEMPDSATIVEWGVFLKAGTSVIGPGGTIQLPYIDKRTDYEGELAVVIGRGGKDIAIADALDHVFGYTCLFDITVRSSEDRSTRKSFDTFTPIGPWVVTADSVPDAAALRLRLEVNGEVRQDASTAQLIYGVPELIAYASSVMTLKPGDVIATGTPAGVGPLSDGDRLQLTIDGIGMLTADVSATDARPYSERPGPETALRRQQTSV